MSILLNSGCAPTVIAGSKPSLDYKFAIDRNQIDAASALNKLTFTRASSATFTNSNGDLDLASNNVPRFNHNPSTKSSLGLWMESEKTNLASYSSDLSNSSWTNTNSKIASAAYSPIQRTDAWLISYSGYGGLVKPMSIELGVSYTVSVWIKAVPGVSYPPNTCVVGINGSDAVGGVTDYSSLISTTQWRRCTHTFVSGVANGSWEWHFGRNRSGSGNIQILVWGPQVEVGSTATSYVASGASATTLTEVATISLAGLPTTRTLVEKPLGCASISGNVLTLNSGYTIERVMVFPINLTSEQITSIRSAM